MCSKTNINSNFKTSQENSPQAILYYLNSSHSKRSMHSANNFTYRSRLAYASEEVIERDFSLPLKQNHSASHNVQKFHPVTIFIHECPRVSETSLYSKPNLLFCYKAVIECIDSLLEGNYVNFDGLTTTNCCHGMALFSRDLILSAQQLDLNRIRNEGIIRILKLEQETSENGQFPCTWFLPESLIDLTSLYILTYLKEICSHKGGRTIMTKLKKIAPISTNTCKKIADGLKKKYSNKVALRYSQMLEEIPSCTVINNAPAEMWGKYIQKSYLRSDNSELLYASSLFSMQICLAHLAFSRAKIAIVSDHYSSTGELKGRYTRLFQGDGKNHFEPVNESDFEAHTKEPVIIIGGCVYSDHMDMEDLESKMQPWTNQIMRLIMACEVFYPHFPRVMNDPHFDSSPITPHEPVLQEILKDLSIPGVSAEDPSLFCSTHIYSASLEQILKHQNNPTHPHLPLSFIPGRLLSNSLMTLQQETNSSDIKDTI